MNHERTIGVWDLKGDLMFIRTYSTNAMAMLIYEFYKQNGHMVKIY